MHVGKPYGYGALHHLLSNPVYAGCIGHRGEIHEGQHAEIIPKEKWQQVQNMLQDKSAVERGHKKQTMKNILKGKIFGTDGMIYTPVRANRHGKHYRYYVRRDVVQGQASKTDVHARLPAHEIEDLVMSAIVTEMKEPEKLAHMLGLDVETSLEILMKVSEKAEFITDLHKAVQKIFVERKQVMVEVSAKNLAKYLNADFGIVFSIQGEFIHRLQIPYHTKRAHRGAVKMFGGDGSDPLDVPKSHLESLVKGTILRYEHFSGRSFGEIAKANNCSRSFVIQLIEKSFQIS